MEENSFLFDNTTAQTTTKAQGGRRASGFVQVGLPTTKLMH